MCPTNYISPKDVRNMLVVSYNTECMVSLVAYKLERQWLRGLLWYGRLVLHARH